MDARIPQHLVEIDDRVIGLAGPDPAVDGLAFRLEVGGPEAGEWISLERVQRAAVEPSVPRRGRDR